MSKFFSKYGVAFAFLLLAIVGGYAIERQARSDAHKLWRSQILVCGRSNTLRVENNHRVSAHHIEIKVLQAFLQSATEARTVSGTPKDLETADTYKKLSKTLESVTFRMLPLIDCERAYPKP